jgi:hypothetical protein
MTGPSSDILKAKAHAEATQIVKTPAIMGGLDGPQTPAKAYEMMRSAWTMLRDVHAGTHRLRHKASLYLPKSPAEYDEDWKARVQRTEAFNGLRQTIDGLIGMVFRRDPTMGEDTPDELLAHWENIDGAGTHGAVFARRVAEDGLLVGHGAILVDFPDANPDRTLADEASAGLRPYWVYYTAEQILSWRTATVGGQTVLSQVVLHETVRVPEGAFTEKDVEVYRVFRLEDNGVVAWERWVAGPGRPPAIEAEGVMGNQTRIPVVPVMIGKGRHVFESTPLLRDLADTVLAHINVRSDHRYSLHKASIPVLVAKGRNADEPLVVGVNQVVDVPADGDLAYVEHAGTALGATRQELQDLLSEMAAQGLAMLQRETRAAETAEAKRLDKNAADSQLAVVARTLQDAIEQAWVYHAAYLNTEPPSCSVNQDFESLTLGAAEIQTFSQLVTAGQLSLDTMWQMLAEGNVLPRDFDADAERENIATPVTLPAAGMSVATAASPAPPADDIEDGEFEVLPPTATPAAPALPAPVAAAPAPAPVDLTAITAAIERMVELQAQLIGVMASMPAPVVNVAPPAVTVQMPSGNKTITLQRDAAGNTTGGTVEAN